jgi:hypothetical protein
VRGYVLTKTFAKERIPVPAPPLREVRSAVRTKEEATPQRSLRTSGAEHPSQRPMRQGGSKHKGGNETPFRLRRRCSSWALMLHAPYVEDAQGRREERVASAPKDERFMDMQSTSGGHVLLVGGLRRDGLPFRHTAPSVLIR